MSTQPINIPRSQEFDMEKFGAVLVKGLKSEGQDGGGSGKQQYDRHGHRDDDDKKMGEERRFIRLLKCAEKVSKLHFFIQDALGGASATVWEVARSAVTATSPSSFGQVRVLDDLITATPDRNSKVLGRAQGMITFTGMGESALTMTLNFYFTAGEFKGSTLCVVGRNPISSTNRELPIVGGTGIFRMARGYTISKTYSYDAVANYGVLEYTVFVAYLEDEDCDHKS